MDIDRLFARVESFLVALQVAAGLQELALVDVEWLGLSEIPERDRSLLWAAGLLGVGGFLAEALAWGNQISYPTGTGPSS